MKYIRRVLEVTVKRYLRSFPIIGVTGPRQSGKSTMLKELLADSYEYVTFDDFQNVNLFNDDPARFMRIHSDRVIFDEVQKVPQIFDSLKTVVDEERARYGRFVITGSSQFSFMKGVSETLAGRIGILTLLPFQYSEIPSSLRDKSVYMGNYPEIVKRGFDASWDWYSSYIETYLVRDVRELSNIGNIRDFRRCLQLLATRVSQVLNMSEVARDVGVTVATIKSWISVLEASYILFLLPPFYQNIGKRTIKSPKLYFHDTGIVSFLTGISTDELFEKGPMRGAIFENYIVSEIMKKEKHSNTDSGLYYVRTSHGVEVDLIVDRKIEKEFIEIKSSESFSPEMFKPLELLRGKKEKGTLVYRGKDIDLSDGLMAASYSNFLTRS